MAVSRGGLLSLGLVVLAASGCGVAPAYKKPSTPAPPSYGEAGEWKKAEPVEAAPRGAWWQAFGDPELTALEEQIDVSNQNLKAAEARFREARALLRQSRSALFPNGTLGAQATRTRTSRNALPFSPTNGSTYDDATLSGTFSYEVDAWGRVRSTVAAARATLEASAADLAVVNLGLHADLAADYFQLRGLDAEERLFRSTVSAYEEALSLTRDRFQGGVASGVDVAQAETQLETTKAQAIDLGVQRAALEHAIAVLVGQPPAGFHVPANPSTGAPPSFPTGVPSELLERRPDIAGAERRVVAANAQIGVARAAYFPVLNLTGTGGFESGSLSTWLSAPSALWSAGVSALVTLFDAGKRRAITDQAWASYDEAVADYRETVLTGFEEVEDSLASLRLLADESRVQQDAVQASSRSLALSTNRYKGGVATYLEVITAQSIDLANERTAVEIHVREMLASVELVRALGGGWSASALSHLTEAERTQATP
jgi:NodT family efflux transporter outer membrane factor (OMF) lipoprotein